MLRDLQIPTWDWTLDAGNWTLETGHDARPLASQFELPTPRTRIGHESTSIRDPASDSTNMRMFIRKVEAKGRRGFLLVMSTQSLVFFAKTGGVALKPQR